MKIKKYPEVTLLILNWNGLEDTLRCVESVKNINYPNYHIIIIDNGSTDGSGLSLVRNYQQDLRISLILNKTNLGYAEGNNVGIEQALARKSEYLLILNNDTVVRKDFLLQMVDTAEREPETGIFGPKVLFLDEPDRVFSAGESLNLWFLRCSPTMNRLDNPGDDTLKKADAIVGCAMLIRRELIEKIGKFDPVYFLTYEEVELCLRCKRAGYSIKVVQKAVIYHKGSASMGGTEHPLTLYYKTRNAIYFMRKNASFYHWITFTPMVLFVITKRVVRALLRRDMASIRAVIDAVVWNLKKKPSN